MIILRRMRNRDLQRLTKIVLPKFVGVVAEEDGKTEAVCCIIWGDGGLPYLCLEIGERLRQKPHHVARVGRILVRGATQSGGDLYAIEDNEEPTSARLLELMGFRPTGELKDGERLFKWRQSLQQ